MEQPKDFRSTVLQAPARPGADDERERERDHDRDRDRDRDRDGRRHRHDLSSIVASPAGETAGPPPHQRHSSFNLRSPSHTEFPQPHHSPATAYTSPRQVHSHPHSHAHPYPDHRSPPPRPHQPGLSHPNHFGSPPSSSSGRGAAGTPSLPALGGGSSSAGHHHPQQHHQPAPLSPLLHAPSGAYYPPPDRHPSRERERPTTSSYYDPLTDTTRERRPSDTGSRYATSAQTSPHKHRDPYSYSQTRPSSADHRDHRDHPHNSYFGNGNGSGSYASPSPGNYPPRSPVSRPRPTPASAGSISPGRPHPPHMDSPSARHASSNGSGPSALPAMDRADASPLKAPAPAPASVRPGRFFLSRTQRADSDKTPSRSADPMSFSNILSSAEPVSKPRPESPIPDKKEPAAEAAAEAPKTSKASKASKAPKAPKVSEVSDATPRDEPHIKDEQDDTEPEVAPRASSPKAKDKGRNSVPGPKAKKPAVRKSKSRASDLRDEAAPKGRRRASSSARETPTPRVPTKRQANGQSKQQKGPSAEALKRVHDEIAKLEAGADELDDSELEREAGLFKQHGNKRRRVMEDLEMQLNDRRRDEMATRVTARLGMVASSGQRRYEDLYLEEALTEVREREIFAEKERKKDMQRKRRREKSMAVTMEAKNAALKKAENAEDELERLKYLREAERAGKKAQQTKLILQKGIKGPARNVELNLEGGTMSSFQASDAEPTSTKKSNKGRGGPRPKKSKEQKQAEKDSAEAAQAALDAGEELPSREESKIRIKINKSKTKDKDKDKDLDKDAEKDEEAEPVEEKKEVKEKKRRRKKKDKDGEAEGAEDNKENEKPKSKKEEKAEQPPDPDAKFHTKGYIQIYDQIWRDLARKDVSKTYKLAAESYQTKASNLKKTAILASKEAKRWQLRTNKGTKDQQARAKRVMRDMMGFWKRNEREERDLRKAAEKQELENARKEEAEREAARQKRKLNFLISQTELYSHFIGKKIKTAEVERSTDNPEIAAENKDETERNENMHLSEPSKLGSKVTNFENLDFDAEDESVLQEAAMANAQNAIAEAQKKAREFNDQGLDMDEEGEMNFQNPAGMGDVEIEQPKLINTQLKEYQLKGLNWLANLYEQGINGILADEMGLGKTVQSISVMAYLAEKYDVWGPFLVVAPASTLHNWEQEIRKFVPEFKILPYWGNAADRKVLRKFWDRKQPTYKKESNFHVCVTSYQMVVSDVSYFQKMRWQYMILDEAQAIKSSSSSRWKSLLNFHCRNRLLLTGTPIQNNMQELWALLHFIMPSLFDSHDEFSEWFSKDIESHAQSNTKLNEDQLKRLHMILKPFMLRRVKKHVQKELGDKIEKDVFCDLTYRQRAYYGNLRNQISIMDLIEKATMGDDNDSGTLMNIVMQFRKVCNHPDLFERADTSSPFSFGYFAETASFVREGNKVEVGYSTRNMIEYELPRLVWREGGRLHKAGRDNEKAGWRNKTLQHLFNIWTPENVREHERGSEAFSWLRFADTSAGEVYEASHEDIITRAAKLSRRNDRLGFMNVAYTEPEDEKFTPAHALFQIKARQNLKPLADVGEQGVLGSLMNVGRTTYEDLGLGRLEQAGRPSASAPPIEVACNSRGTGTERDNVMFNAPIRKTLFGPTPIEQKALIEQKVPLEQYPAPALHPEPDHEKKKFTNIAVPSMRRFVTDSGKLAKLDELLFKLKNEGHRVLLYFQMTRMIDLMEEYLTYRNYKYCRLDGSTKLEDRRDTVADFQTRPEIFVFLLSTRAGGLGINLTSADTVIFYDSDWNPTIDSQAMDRAHRLGQTRQVTVYRLITAGTIEERIRKRALQKEEVQRVVIQGGGGNVDFSGRRPTENRNRDIAMWLADDEQAEMIERREKELLESGELEKAQKKKGGKRKRAAAGGGGGGGGEGVSLDEMYHEGEGNFDDKQASGTVTPVVEADGKGPKKRKTSGQAGGKRAKTLKQRLAVADGTA